MRPCPACGRKIQDAAQRCHYCHAPVPHARRSERVDAPPLASGPARKTRFGTAVLLAVVIALVVGALLTILL